MLSHPLAQPLALGVGLVAGTLLVGMDAVGWPLDPGRLLQLVQPIGNHLQQLSPPTPHTWWWTSAMRSRGVHPGHPRPTWKRPRLDVRLNPLPVSVQALDQAPAALAALGHCRCGGARPTLMMRSTMSTWVIPSRIRRRRRCRPTQRRRS